MQYLTEALKAFKVFTGLRQPAPTTFTDGWVGGLSENANKAISASIEVEVELS